MSSKERQNRIKMVVGIDPGIDKSGVCFYDNEIKVMKSLSLWELFEIINGNRDYTYVVENSNLVKGNWHGKTGRGNVGKNKAISQVIVDYLKHLGVNYKEVIPAGYTKLAKNVKIFKQDSGYDGKTNEHQRAAYFIAKSYERIKTT